MSDTERPEPRHAAVHSPTAGVAEAFELLRSEGRLAILWALWEAFDPADSPTAIPFSELADRTAYDSPGNLSYHLDKLVGRYVEKTEDGYLLSGTGREIVRAIVSGAMTSNVAFDPFEIDDPCPYCGGLVEVSYADNYIQARCRSCGGSYPEAGPTVSDVARSARNGVITLCEFPPAGVRHRGPGDTLGAYLTRASHQAFSMLAGTCPACGGRTWSSTNVCEAHEADSAPCEACGFTYPAQTLLVCEHCKLRINAATRWLTLRDPRVGSFFQTRGVDVRSGFSMELWSTMDRADVTVQGTDPVALSFRYRLGEDSLRVEVDDELNVTSIAG